MFFSVLGPLTVQDHDVAVDLGTPKDRAVLAVLLARVGRSVRADSLVETVWGERAPRNGVKNLQVNVHRLRRALGDPGRILFTGDGYRLVAAAGELDARRAESLAGRAGRADPAQASELLGEALALWRGEPFAGHADLSLVRPEVARLTELRLTLLERRIGADLRCGRHADLVAELTALTAEQPLRERFHGQLMLALSRSGRQADALEVYRSARRILRDELGIDPSGELREIEARVLAGDLVTVAARAPARPAREVRADPAPAHPVAPAQLPAAIGSFTGRAAPLERLDAALTAGARVVALVGTGGVGKTALAVHWAHLVRHRFPDGQLYVDLRGFASAAPLSTEHVVARFLRALGFTGEQIPVDPEERLALLRTALADRRVLMLLDNAHSAEQVRPLLTAAPGCLTLVTSRGSLRGLVARDDATPIELTAFDPGEARALLERLLGPVLRDEHPDTVARLAHRCAYLPLALRIAAANIAQDTGRSVTGHLAALNDRDLLDALSPDDDPDAAVRTTFDSSYTALRPEQRRLLRRLGLVPGRDITPDAAAALLDSAVGEARRLFDQLVAVHLVERRAGERYQLHDLLRSYAAERAAQEEDASEREAARRRLFDFYLHSAHQATVRISLVRTPPPAPLTSVRPRSFAGVPEAMSWLDAELANLLAAVTAAAAEGPAPYAWRIVAALEFYFRATCAYETWTSAGATALDAARRAGDAAGVANIHVSLGHACMESGSFAAAARHGQAALDHAGDAGWHAGSIWALAVMGRAYGFTGETRAAVAALERAARLARAHDLRDPLPLLAATLHLGDARLYGGELAAARRQYEEVLRQTTDDGDKLFRGLALLGLGTASRYAGALDQAVDHLESAIQQLDSISAQSGHAEALAMLSLAHHDAGRDLTARQIGERAVSSALERRESGKIPVALISLAATYERSGPSSTAPDLYAQALAAARDAGRPLQEIEALCGLARARLRSGQPDVALAHARTALDLGRDDEWLVQAGMIHTTLAQAYLARQDTATAIRHAHRAIEITERAGARLCRAHALRALGEALRETGGPAAAHPVWREAAGLYTAIGAPEARILARRITRAC